MGEALRTRELISQAQGVIMQREGIGEDLAYTKLRRDSLENGRPLLDRAQQVVDFAARFHPMFSIACREVEHE